MEVIVYVPLGDPDGDLLGVSLPDYMEKLFQTRAKLHGLGGIRLV